MSISESTQRALGTRWCSTGIWLVLLGVVLVAASLVGGRLGLLSPIASFMFFGIGCIVVAVAGLVTLIGIAISRGTAGDTSAPRAWSALAVSIVLIGTTLGQLPESSGSPPIHDITTDTQNPPLFEAILPLRADAPNPPGYAGTDTANQQQSAYPDLVTLTINKSLAEVFASAEQVARDLDWHIVTADQAAGRIEATDTTTWFRFQDDVVIRLTTNDTGTNVDVRSKSRVGRSDLGANASRIRVFLERLESRVAQ